MKRDIETLLRNIVITYHEKGWGVSEIDTPSFNSLLRSYNLTVNSILREYILLKERKHSH